MESVTGTKLLVQSTAKPHLLNTASFQSNKKQVRVLLMQKDESQTLLTSFPLPWHGPSYVQIMK